MSTAPVYHISVPNPYFEGTNSVYWIDSDPLTLIDSGMCMDFALDAIKIGLAEHGRRLEDVQLILLTHKHVDHVGSTSAIQQVSGARAMIHADDWEAVTSMADRHFAFVDRIRDRLISWGTPEVDVDTVATRMEHSGWDLTSIAAEKLVDGQQITIGSESLEVIHTPGHTVGSACFRYGKHLFTGDHVLPTISPNVGGGDLGESGLLAVFLKSLQRVQALQSDGLIAMPGHGAPFSTLADRCAELIDHHQERLDKIESLLGDGQPRTVYQVAHSLFGNMDDIHLMLGTAEAQSHLEYLEQQGAVLHDDGLFQKN